MEKLVEGVVAIVCSTICGIVVTGILQLFYPTSNILQHWYYVSVGCLIFFLVSYWLIN